MSTRAKAAEVDPENILLWRMPRRRLEAEADPRRDHERVRRTAHPEGGSLLPYKDREYVANTARGGNIDYDRPIRAVYIPVVRSSMYDVFQAFDLPGPIDVERRSRFNCSRAAGSVHDEQLGHVAAQPQDGGRSAPAR